MHVYKNNIENFSIEKVSKHTARGYSIFIQ